MVYTIMDIPAIEIILFTIISYLMGVGTGLTICCKYKETFLQRARSVDNLRQYNHQPIVSAVPTSNTPPLQPTAPINGVDISLKI